MAWDSVDERYATAGGVMGGSASSVRAVSVEGSVPVELSVEVPAARVALRAAEVPVRDLAGDPVRRLPARRIGPGPEPTGPGRASRRPVRVCAGAPVRRVPAGRASAARPVAIRSAPPRALVGRGGLRSESRYAARRAVAQFVLVCVAAAVVVGALGLLGDVVRAVRVPATTGVVQVHAGESIWQVARRVAPSADPGAVAARIVELNDLGSPSVRGGQVLVSPIG
jgi:hypothetical protein